MSDGVCYKGGPSKHPLWVGATLRQLQLRVWNMSNGSIRTIASAPQPCLREDNFGVESCRRGGEKVHTLEPCYGMIEGLHTFGPAFL